jgi:hypothetical protein
MLTLANIEIFVCRTENCNVDPGTNSWTTTSTTNAPSGRFSHTAVWTGSELIVWAGDGTSGLLNTGSRYNPDTDIWIPTSTASAPTGREYDTAVWDRQ